MREVGKHFALFFVSAVLGNFILTVICFIQTPDFYKNPDIILENIIIAVISAGAVAIIMALVPFWFWLGKKIRAIS